MLADRHDTTGSGSASRPAPRPVTVRHHLQHPRLLLILPGVLPLHRHHTDDETGQPLGPGKVLFVGTGHSAANFLRRELDRQVVLGHVVHSGRQRAVRLDLVDVQLLGGTLFVFFVLVAVLRKDLRVLAQAELLHDQLPMPAVPLPCDSPFVQLNGPTKHVDRLLVVLPAAQAAPDLELVLVLQEFLHVV